jgi:L-iditol 2-dehydrogenase
MAKMKGVKKIFAADINRSRLELAKKFGADHVIDANNDLLLQLKELNDGKGVDKVILCTGATKAALATLDCVDRGGIILFFAVPDPTVKIPIPITQFWRNEITIRTSYGAAPRDLEEALQIITQKRVNATDMITHRLDIREAAEGFKLVAEAGKSLKVILEPNRSC